MVMLKAEGLKKHFGKVQALRGVDLELSEGEVYGLLDQTVQVNQQQFEYC